MTESVVADRPSVSTSERPALRPLRHVGRAFFIFDVLPWVSVLREFRDDLIRMGIEPALLSSADLERKS